MKRCQTCGQTYTDTDINFCLNDGELLSRISEDRPYASFGDEPPPTLFADDSPPTLLMNSARVTNQTNWQASPPVPWQSHRPLAAGFTSGLPAHLQPRNQTLPTVSLILGISSLIMICCFGGIWLGLPAAILGFLGMRNADAFPDRFSGRGMAVTAIIIGTITFFISIVHIIFTAISGR